MNSSIFRLVLIFSLFGLAACETVEGVGEDIQSGGQAISNAANDAQN